MRFITFILVLFQSCKVALAGPGGVCEPSRSQNTTEWVFSAVSGPAWSSCASSRGGVNDLGTYPMQCESDPTSVRIAVSSGLAECLVASSFDCKIPMYDFVSLDYDVHVSSCNGIWAAPLWMTPDTWQWDGGSGEIDSLEMCPRDSIYMNFAGGGKQTQLDQGVFNIDGMDGHVTVRKDSTGIVTTAACKGSEAASNGGQCAAPTYQSCDECLSTTSEGANTYACWCNPNTNPENIYGSGGCQNNADCMWTLVSDVWNGVTGDDGYFSCTSAVSSIDLPLNKPNLNSDCAFSVERITLRGGGPNESLQWGAGSPAYCSKLTTDPSP